MLSAENAIHLLWVPHLGVGLLGAVSLIEIAAARRQRDREASSWHHRWLQSLTVLASVTSLTGCLILAPRVLEEPLSQGWLYLDPLGLWFTLIVAVVGVAASFHAIGYHRFLGGLKRHSAKSAKVSARFYMLFNLFLASMLAVQIFDNLLVICIAVEITTVISAFLVCHERRENRNSVEAAWKYVILGSVGIVFAFLGTLLLFHAFEATAGRSLDLSDLLSIQGKAEVKFLQLAFFFALIGYGTKAGLAPLHTWLPDADSEAPSAVSALLSGVVLKSALYALLRFYELMHRFAPEQVADFASHILLGAGLLSIVVAVPFIVRRQPRAQPHRFKRILAYHSLEHMGIVVFGIGLGTPAGVFAALLHALYHAINKALMFLVHGTLKLEDERRGLPGTPWIQLSRSHALLLGLGAVALVGSPPFAIFTSKLMILREALSGTSEQPWLGLAIVIFVLSLALIFAGLVHHASDRLLGDDVWLRGEGVKNIKQVPGTKVTRYRVMGIPVVLLTLLILVFGFGVPAPMAELVRAAAGCVIPEAGP
jgi:hydrogenase-4 component F